MHCQRLFFYKSDIWGREQSSDFVQGNFYEGKLSIFNVATA